MVDIAQVADRAVGTIVLASVVYAFAQCEFVGSAIHHRAVEATAATVQAAAATVAMGATDQTAAAAEVTTDSHLGQFA